MLDGPLAGRGWEVMARKSERRSIVDGKPWGLWPQHGLEGETQVDKIRSNFWTVVAILALVTSVAVLPALAAHEFNVNADGFEIDDDLEWDGPGNGGYAYDWETALDNAGSGDALAPFFGPGVISDEIYSTGGLSDSTHFKGGNKFLDPASWTVISKNGGSAQTDLGNAYIAARYNAAGDPILYVGFERFKEEGDFHLDVEINKSQAVNGVPQRSAGDFAIIIDILKNPVDGNDLRVRVLRFTSPSTGIDPSRPNV